MTVAKRRARRKHCFVISPIGHKGSAVRTHADKVLRRIVRPALRGTGYVAKRIDEMFPVGNITETIVESLRDADLVLADLTYLNTNVFYELGIRQAWNRPVIAIADKSTQLPFDVDVLNTVFYGSVDERDACDQAQRSIRAVLKNAERQDQGPRVFRESLAQLSGKHRWNPLYVALVAALQDLHNALHYRHMEVLEETEHSPGSSRDSLALSVSRVFARLSDQLHMLSSIAQGPIGAGMADERLLALIEKAMKLNNRADKVRKLLTEARPGKAALVDAGAVLQEIMGSAEHIANSATAG